MTEKWKFFLKSPIPSYDMDVEFIIQDTKNTRIKIIALFDEDISSIKVCFDGIVPIVNSYDKDIKMKKIDALRSKYGDKFFQENIIFKVHESELIKEMNTTRDEFYLHEETQFKHFVIITDESYIDIVSSTEPQIISDWGTAE